MTGCGGVKQFEVMNVVVVRVKKKTKSSDMGEEE